VKTLKSQISLVLNQYVLVVDKTSKVLKHGIPLVSATSSSYNNYPFFLHIKSCIISEIDFLSIISLEILQNFLCSERWLTFCFSKTWYKTTVNCTYYWQKVPCCMMMIQFICEFHFLSNNKLNSQQLSQKITKRTEIWSSPEQCWASSKEEAQRRGAFWQRTKTVESFTGNNSKVFGISM
jgi:hypothetical protein